DIVGRRSTGRTGKLVQRVEPAAADQLLDLVRDLTALADDAEQAVDDGLGRPSSLAGIDRRRASKSLVIIEADRVAHSSSDISSSDQAPSVSSWSGVLFGGPAF